MRDNGKEDARRMRDNRKDARKRGGGWINEGGHIHDINSFNVEMGGGGGGGRINDGGHSDGTLRYNRTLL